MYKCRTCYKLTDCDGLCFECSRKFQDINESILPEHKALKLKGLQRKLLLRKEKQKRYYWKHPFLRLAKAIKKRDKSSTIKAIDLFHIAKNQKLICAISGRKLTSDTISPDHIISLSNGGDSSISNIQLVHRSVNYAKHFMEEKEFILLCNDIVSFHKTKYPGC